MTLEKAFDMARTYPEAEQMQVMNFIVSIKPKKSKADEMAEFESLMNESQQWAKDVGLTPDDITRAIKEVRRKKRQQA